MAAAINISQFVATILAGAALSGEVDIGGNTLVGITMPAAWTTAAMTFSVSTDGGTTWCEMTTSAGAEVSYTVAASQYIAVDPTLWRGVNAVKVRSGTLASAVNQVAQALVTLITRPVL